MQRLKTALAVGTIIASYGLVMGTAEAQDKEISLRDQKVADVKKHEMTAEELEHIIRDGGRHVGAPAE